MEPIELLRCIACHKILDQWTMVDHAVHVCKVNRFVQVKPGLWHKLCWFLGEPKHVFGLLKKDFMEKL